MSQKFINWENMSYIIDQLKKESIDHVCLDAHMDAMWETRERVTNNIKYDADINPLTEQAYTLEDYDSDDITPHKSIVGINQHNLIQDGRLTTIEAKNTEQDGILDDHGTTLGSHTSTLTDHGGRLDGHDTTLGSHTSTLTDHGGRLDGHDTTLRSHTDTLTDHERRITSSEELLAMIASLPPLATDADIEGMLNEIFGNNSNDSNS